MEQEEQKLNSLPDNAYREVGQVFEAAIPIAIIAVGYGNLMKKNNMLGQNVIIQSIGASSGVIVAGAIFT